MHLQKEERVCLYVDKGLVEKSKELGFNLSKTFENHLKHLINEYSPVSMQNNANSTDYKSCVVKPLGLNNTEAPYIHVYP
jgi:hypothetical protein